MKAQAVAAPRSMAIDAVHHQPVQQVVAEAPAEAPKTPAHHSNEQPQQPTQAPHEKVHSTVKQHTDHSVAIAISMTILIVGALSALAVYAYLQGK